MAGCITSSGKRLAAVAALWVVALSAWAVTPTVQYESDVTDTMRARGLRWQQASSWNMIWRYTEDGDAMDLSDSSGIIWRFGPTNPPSWTSTVTGTLYNATNGQVQISITPQSINTNGYDYGWELFCKTPTSELAYVYGSLQLLPRIGAGSDAILLGTNIDWSLVNLYLNTTNRGPIRPGDGITATLNSDGSATFAASGGSGMTNGLASVAYVDGATGECVQVAGDTMTGTLVVNGELIATNNVALGPVNAGGAALSIADQIYVRRPILLTRSSISASNGATIIAMQGTNVLQIGTTSGLDAIRIQQGSGYLFLTNGAVSVGTNFLPGQTLEAPEAALHVHGNAKVSGGVTSAGLMQPAAISVTGTAAFAGSPSGITWGGTNVVPARNGNVGNTGTVYWTVGGTNYHLRLY